MSAITRDEVAHLARLSRLALDEDELDHLAAQLDVIISAVARVQQVAAEETAETEAAPQDQPAEQCAAADWPIA